MRRRTFLTATAIGTTVIALLVLTTYTRSKGPVPTPSFAPMPTPSRTPMPDPPNAAAVPSSFSSAALWPDLGTPTSITALREHYLCGGIVLDHADEARRTVPDGRRPRRRRRRRGRLPDARATRPVSAARAARAVITRAREVSTLSRARQQVVDYLDGLDEDTDHADWQIDVVPDIGGLAAVKTTRQAADDAKAPQDRAAAASRRAAAALRAEVLTVAGTAAIYGYLPHPCLSAPPRLSPPLSARPLAAGR